MFQGGLAWERSADDWAWALGVNLYGLINGVQAFLPRMLEVGEPGHVVNTASMAGHICAPYAGPYQVSKFAAYGYSESLGHDLAAVGADIGVSVLCPSLVATGIGTSGRNRPPSMPASGGDDVDVRRAGAGADDHRARASTRRSWPTRSSPPSGPGSSSSPPTTTTASGSAATPRTCWPADSPAWSTTPEPRRYSTAGCTACQTASVMW